MVQAENWANTPPDDRTDGNGKPMTDTEWNAWYANAMALAEANHPVQE
jgi:hypothetical protein